MNRTVSFAKRNLKEMCRDVLSYIFCLAFPIVMLVIMTLVNESIPAEANMTIFRIDNLLGGIIIFGQTFVMLFTTLSVSKDRETSFLMRLYASPMKSSNFTMGYFLPMILIALAQAFVAVVASFVISLIVGVKLNLVGVLLSIIISVPSAIMFIGIGVLFGTILNSNAAPGLCSIVISLGSFLGGIWFDAEGTGGVMYKICKCLPFIYCTRSVRSTIAMDFSKDAFAMPLLVVVAVAVVFAVLSAAVFKTKMKADLN